MARHKTAHRKALEAHNKAQRAARDAAVLELAQGDSLKQNAASNAKAVVKASKKS